LDFPLFVVVSDFSLGGFKSSGLGKEANRRCSGLERGFGAGKQANCRCRCSRPMQTIHLNGIELILFWIVQVDPEVGLPGRLEASFGGDKFGQRSLEAYLALGMNEHGFLERALGFRGMKLSDEVSGASPQAMPHKVIFPSPLLFFSPLFVRCPGISTVTVKSEL
jgi:hypothetical protein